MAYKIPEKLTKQINDATTELEAIEQAIDDMRGDINSNIADLNEEIAKYNNIMKNVNDARDNIADELKKAEGDLEEEDDDLTRMKEEWENAELQFLPMVQEIELSEMEDTRSVISNLPMSPE